MKLLVVEPKTQGHRGFYLRLVLQALSQHQVTLLASSEVPSGFSDAWPAVRRLDLPAAGTAAQAVGHAALVAQGERFDRVFFPYIDSALDALRTAARDSLPPVAGIWMSPSTLDRRYRYLPAWGKRNRFRGQTHRWLAEPTTAHQLPELLFLLEQERDALARVAPGIRALHLCDPPEAVSALGQAQARAALGLAPEGCVLLHPGGADRRKGLGLLLQAYARAEARGLATPFLLRMGPNRLKKAEQHQLDRMVAGGRAKASDGYVPLAMLTRAYAACDWVSLPYRKFRHSSGILVNAAAAGRPVLVSGFGHIGRAVREGQPGRVFKHGSVSELARALTELCPAPFAGGGARAVDAAQDAFCATLRRWADSIV